MLIYFSEILAKWHASQEASINAHPPKLTHLPNSPKQKAQQSDRGVSEERLALGVAHVVVQSFTVAVEPAACSHAQVLRNA